ncbi:MAG: phosphatase PAP2 family protein [Candidatus Aenigmarchaeota archaeon]|nr:phosphatase PAP2 family protein [Candidatus Aenigmarchaeota archaeon]
MIDDIYGVIDKKPFHIFALLLLFLNIAGVGENPNYLTILSLIGSLVSIIISIVMKFYFKTGRPQHNKYRVIPYGFPSGHAHVIFTVATIYSYYTPVLAAPLFLFALFVSVSRLKVKAHTLRDVMAGLMLGLFTGLVTIILAG